MKMIDTENNIYKNIMPISQNLGYSIVELNINISKNSKLNIQLVIYKKDGVSIDGCSKLHKIIMPRLEVLENNKDIYLEISSPGLNRNIKSRHEFIIFKNNKVKLLVEDSTEWISGTISEADSDNLILKTQEGTETIDFSQIKKAKLQNH